MKSQGEKNLEPRPRVSQINKFISTRDLNGHRTLNFNHVTRKADSLYLCQAERVQQINQWFYDCNFDYVANYKCCSIIRFNMDRMSNGPEVWADYEI